MDRPVGITRRHLVQTCVASALAASAAVPEKSRVVIARDSLLGSSRATPDSVRVLKVLDRALQSLYNSDTAVEAWKKVVRPTEIVGLKVNCLAGRGGSTSTVLVEAICERLRQAGILDQNLVIWDRSNWELESGGFRVASRKDRRRCIGNEESGYDPDLAVWGNAGSRVTRTLTRLCDAVINVPVLKDHGITGVTMALKSFFGSIHNPNKYHLNNGDPYVADVYMLPPIRQKVRLTICDAIVAQYEGGPSYKPQWSWPYNGLLVSRDPVALDYTGWQVIERKRAERGMKPLRDEHREPSYIARAADSQHQLGTNDPRLIDLVEV